MIDLPLHPSWQAALRDELGAPYLTALVAALREEAAAGAAILPPADEWLAAFSHPIDAVRVVVLGQDPYHGAGQAHGLAFSVRRGVRVPPSLRNIYAELASDVGMAPPAHGDLRSWAAQGVLLLNTVLTVLEGSAGAHAGRGWERFTDAAIHAVAASEQPTVFILWGNHAARKAQLIDGARHLILTSAHPSPLSARRGFLGSRPFSQANAFLASHGRGAIDWRLPD
jgi:uracil-DNA glycosylase